MCVRPLLLAASVTNENLIPFPQSIRFHFHFPGIAACFYLKVIQAYAIERFLPLDWGSALSSPAFRPPPRFEVTESAMHTCSKPTNLEQFKIINSN